MRQYLFLALLCCSMLSWGQRSYVFGLTMDSASVALSDVTVRNQSAGLVTSSDSEGKFRVPGMLGDTITIAHVGYETVSTIIDEYWIQEESMIFQLLPETTYLDEVVVTKFPAYAEFKEQILAANPEDTAFQVFGVPRVAISQEDRLNASLAIRGPFSAVHNTFSKRAKEQKKLRKMLQNQGHRAKANQKFTREWVAQQTKLQGDKLTSFIAFCNFSDEYLVKTPEYMIHEEMMALLPKFLEEYEQKG